MAVEDPDYSVMAEVQGDSDTPVTADKLAEAQNVEQPAEGDAGAQASTDGDQDATSVTPDATPKRGPGRPRTS